MVVEPRFFWSVDSDVAIARWKAAAAAAATWQLYVATLYEFPVFRCLIYSLDLTRGNLGLCLVGLVSLWSYTGLVIYRIIYYHVRDCGFPIVVVVPPILDYVQYPPPRILHWAVLVCGLI